MLLFKVLQSIAGHLLITPVNTFTKYIIDS